MALDFLKSDKEVAKEFHAAPVVDPVPAKKKQLLTKLDSVIASVKKEPGKSITRWYKVKDGKDGASVGLNIGTVSVVGNTSGQTSNDEIIKADAVAFFEEAKKAIEKGDMDDMIRKAWEGRDQSSASTAQRAPSEVARDIEPWKTYRRNIGRYGLARANELGEKKFGKDLPSVKEEFEKNKDADLPNGWSEGWWKEHFKK
ncbi:hypothetical protein K7H13_13665 [Qipengyuania citrea]|uniref:hypothetical protein n=1 Tax=Qipengyuania citrea TaxID=225971 RepID=UPI001E2AE6BC|nr:hypothetical protein [Qipengyuania citrea]MCD1591796.1 hypothetical protein [Qipengyuania citrea]